MAVQGHPVHVPAGLPIDEVTRLELVETGRANIENRNVRAYETQALEKRLGSQSMTTARISGTRSSGFRMCTRDARACVTDADASLDQYITGLDTWSSTPMLPEAVYSLRAIPSPTADTAVLDSSMTNGMIAIAYARAEDSAALMAVIGADDGGVVSPVTILGGSPYSRGIHAVGAIKDRYFIAIATHVYLGATEVRVFVFDTQNIALGWVSLGTIETDLATPYTSICELSDRLIVAYGISTGANRVVLKAIGEFGVISSTAIAAANTPQLVDVDSTGDVVWVTYDDAAAGNLYAAALQPSDLATATGTSAIVQSSIGATVQSLRICAGENQNAQIWLMTKVAGSATGTSICVTVAAGVTVRGEDGAADATRDGTFSDTVLSSRPFYRDGHYYAVVAAGVGDPENEANYQGTCIVVDWTLSSDIGSTTFLRPVVNIEPGLAPRLQFWSKVYAIDTNRWLFARQFITRGSEQDQTASYGSALVDFDFASRERYRSVDHHGVTIVGGGVTGVWDGADFTESGFLSRPTVPQVLTTGGSLTGTYRYVAVFEDVDAAGNVVVSGISNPSDAVVLVTQKTNLIFTNVTVTYRTRTIGTGSGRTRTLRVRNVLYRTLATGEPPYYRLGSFSTGTSTYDDLDDAILATRPKLYAPNLPGAVGEALDRRAPPQFTHVVSYNGMLVGAKGSSLFWSGQEVYGEATWFNPAFELPIGSGGAITGLAVQDGYIVAFKRDRVFVVSGEIPSDNGAQGGLGAPRLVSSEWGCINADSIVATQLGVFFQSERGIQIFSRAQSVEWIGEPIVDTLEAYPVVTSAVVDGRNSLVRFTLAEAMTDGIATGTGKALIFDLSMKAWISVDDMPAVAQDAAYVDVGGLRYAWLGADGVVHTERDRGSSKECRDDDAFVAAQYATAPWRLGLQQDQRIFEFMPLYQRNSSAGITIEVGEDYGSFGAITADKVWTSSDLDEKATATQISLRSRDHGFATQLRLRDTAPANTTDSGRGITWVGISADIGPKQGPTRATPRIDTGMRR